MIQGIPPNTTAGRWKTNYWKAPTAMRRFVIFVLTYILCLSVIRYAVDTIPEGDLFSVPTPTKNVVLAGYSTTGNVTLKLRNASGLRRYDIGVFGNSRSLGVSREFLNLNGCRFFNFSIGGESMRNSIHMLERLADAEKAPRLALISVDNFELQMYSNPFGARFDDRIRLLWRDIASWRQFPHATVRDLGRAIWRYGWTEWNLVKEYFEADLLFRGIKRILADPSAKYETTTDRWRGYRADGSRLRKTVNPAEAINDEVTRTGTPQIIPAYFVADLEQVASLRDRGIRVVLYETLLNPANFDYYAEHPTPHARRTRRLFKETCTRLNLDCRSLLMTPGARRAAWGDHSHMPDQVVSTIAGEIIQEAGMSCGP